MIEKKANLFICGKELFSLKGFKNTNISEITKMAGMATGTFYNYYSSKEKLFMDIFLEENAKLKKDILEAVDLDADPMKVMLEMISMNKTGMESNPILKEWYNSEVFSKIEQSYREESGIDGVKFLYESFIEIVKEWQEKKKIRNDIDAEEIMAIFSSIINIDTHKEEIGLKYFPQVLEHIAEFVMKGLRSFP